MFFLGVLVDFCLAGLVPMFGNMWTVLTSRPRETPSGVSSQGGAVVLERALPLRYWATKFASGVPTWRLPLWSTIPAKMVTHRFFSEGLFTEQVIITGYRFFSLGTFLELG